MLPADKAYAADDEYTYTVTVNSGKEDTFAGGTTVKLNWNTVAFVRLFSECLAIIPNEATAIIISLDKAYAPQVLDWLSENKPQIEVIR